MCAGRWVAAAAVVGIAAALAAGSGSGGTLGQHGASARLPNLAYARAQVERHRAVPGWREPAPAIDVRRLRGRSVFVVPLLAALPALQQLDAGLSAAAKAAGLTLAVEPADGTPASWAKGVRDALEQGADAIVLAGAPDPAALAPELAIARTAGVPVVVADLAPAGSASGAGSAAGALPPGVDARADAPLQAMARLAADAVIAATEGRARVLLVASGDVPSSAGLAAAAADEYAQVCGAGCATTVVSVPLSRWSTGIAPAVQAALAADPHIGVVQPLYDAMAPLAVEGIQRAGARGRVWVGTAGGSAFVLDLVRSHASGGTVRFDVGTSLPWQGWATLDAVLRALLKEPQPASPLLPLRVFDAANAAAAGRPASAARGYGTAYAAGYRRLWGLARS